MKSVLITTPSQTGGLRPQNCIWSWVSASMCWKWWWKCWNITKSAVGGHHKSSQRNRKNTILKFVRTHWTNMSLKATVLCITSLLVMTCGVTTMSWGQNGSPWSGDVNSPWNTKFSTQPLLGKVMCTAFWDKKRVILLDFLETEQTGGWCPYLCQGGWSLMILEVPSNPSHSMILWLCRITKLTYLCILGYELSFHLDGSLLLDGGSSKDPGLTFRKWKQLQKSFLMSVESWNKKKVLFCNNCGAGVRNTELRIKLKNETSVA